MKPWIKVKPRYDEAQWPPLSAKVSFVRIDPADLKLPGDNQSMSNWVFFVSSYILVLRLTQHHFCLKIKLTFVRCARHILAVAFLHRRSHSRYFGSGCYHQGDHRRRPSFDHLEGHHHRPLPDPEEVRSHLALCTHPYTWIEIENEIRITQGQKD